MCKRVGPNEVFVGLGDQKSGLFFIIKFED